LATLGIKKNGEFFIPCYASSIKAAYLCQNAGKGAEKCVAE
jgi:hypothetical protein